MAAVDRDDGTGGETAGHQVDAGGRDLAGLDHPAEGQVAGEPRLLACLND